MDLNSIPWNLILPVLVIQLLLVVVALIDLVRVKSTNGPKWMWTPSGLMPQRSSTVR